MASDAAECASLPVYCRKLALGPHQRLSTILHSLLPWLVRLKGRFLPSEHPCANVGEFMAILHVSKGSGTVIYVNSDTKPELTLERAMGINSEE